MINKHLLCFSYPCKGKAFVEDKIGPRGIGSTGVRMLGKWVSGSAVGVYKVGSTPLFVVFVDEAGTEYALEHEAQLLREPVQAPSGQGSAPASMSF